MMAGLLFKLSGWTKSFGFIFCAFLAFVGLLLLLVNSIKDIETKGIEAGRTSERSESIQATIEKVEISREAAKQIEAENASGTGSLLYAQCMRSARTPTNCKRFLPH